MSVVQSGEYTATLQEIRDRRQVIGVAPDALTLSELAEETALADVFDDAEAEAILDAHAAAINALEVQVNALRSVLIEAGVLIEAE